MDTQAFRLPLKWRMFVNCCFIVWDVFSLQWCTWYCMFMKLVIYLKGNRVEMSYISLGHSDLVGRLVVFSASFISIKYYIIISVLSSFYCRLLQISSFSGKMNALNEVQSACITVGIVKINKYNSSIFYCTVRGWQSQLLDSQSSPTGLKCNHLTTQSKLYLW